MTVLFVAHDTPEPALYGAMAAILADRLRLPLIHLEQQWETAVYPDACQHAIAEGRLVGSGLIWHERLSGVGVGAPLRWADLPALPAQQDYVIPLGPAQLALWPAQRQALDERGVTTALVRVNAAGPGLVFLRDDVVQTAWGIWRRDGYGRFMPQDDGQDAPRAGVVSAAAGAAPVRIVLLGSRRDQWDAYPAIAAAMGDAADALELPLALRFASPREPFNDILSQAQGLLLPGGASMANVAGQIAAAHYALDNALPTLGLCLGMQTMTTAIAQRALGSDEVNLAEADPDAPVKSFVPLTGTAGYPEHRLGDRRLHTRPDSRMRALLGQQANMRYNHRFHLNPALKPVLENHGLRISAVDESGAIADGVELDGHVFYLGVQGHPELTSAPRRPHPLITAFLRAAAGAKITSA